MTYLQAHTCLQGDLTTEDTEDAEELTSVSSVPSVVKTFGPAVGGS